MTYLNKYDDKFKEVEVLHANGKDLVPKFMVWKDMLLIHFAVNGEGCYHNLVRIESEEHLDQLYNILISKSI